MEVAIVITLMVVGVILLLVELFLIPGLSVAGIAGVLFLGGGVYYAYESLGSIAGHITLLGGLVLLAVAVWIFIKSKALEKMSLTTEINSKNDPLSGVDVKVGDVGVTTSRLAPMGKVKINGSVMEAKALDDFIDQNTEVVILEVNNTNVIVERYTN